MNMKESNKHKRIQERKTQKGDEGERNSTYLYYNKEGMTTITMTTMLCNKNLEDEDFKNKDLFYVTTNTTTMQKGKVKLQEEWKRESWMKRENFHKMKT